MSASLRLTLREMILSGELAPGERITESGLAERLGISRTPVRNTLPALAAEGFLVPSGKRGFAVKEFTEEESLNALELRSALEGERSEAASLWELGLGAVGAARLRVRTYLSAEARLVAAWMPGGHRLEVAGRRVSEPGGFLLMASATARIAVW